MTVDEDGFRNVAARQLRHQDSTFADVRKWRAPYSPEERRKMRAILEEISALARDIPGGMYLTVKVENEIDEIEKEGDTETDEFGDMVPWEDCHFSLWATLDAIRAWDAGKEFTPPCNALTGRGPRDQRRIKI
jgi:hypothetical protein